MKDRPKLLCRTVESGEAGVPGAMQRWCELCAATVWVSPSNLAKVDAGDMDVQCTTCGLEAALLQKDSYFTLTPEQEGELAELGILADAREIVKRSNIAMQRRKKER